MEVMVWGWLCGVEVEEEDKDRGMMVGRLVFVRRLVLVRGIAVICGFGGSVGGVLIVLIVVNGLVNRLVTVIIFMPNLFGFPILAWFMILAPPYEFS